MSEGAPVTENLGTYKAEVENIRAELSITAKIVQQPSYKSSYEIYDEHLKFYFRDGASVEIYNDSFNLGDIFSKAKKAEEGIEQLLIPLAHHNWDWRLSRGVIQCIFSLEKQTEHLAKQREENLVVINPKPKTASLVTHEEPGEG